MLMYSISILLLYKNTVTEMMTACSKFLQRFTYILGVSKTKKNLKTKACSYNQFQYFYCTKTQSLRWWLCAKNFFSVLFTLQAYIKQKNLITKACLCNQLQLWEVTDQNNIDHFLDEKLNQPVWVVTVFENTSFFAQQKLFFPVFFRKFFVSIGNFPFFSQKFC